MASEWAAGLALQEAAAKGVTISSLFNEDAHAGAYAILRLSGLAEALDAARKAGLEEAARCVLRQAGQVMSVRRYLADEIRKLAHPDSAEGGDHAP